MKAGRKELSMANASAKLEGPEEEDLPITPPFNVQSKPAPWETQANDAPEGEQGTTADTAMPSAPSVKTENRPPTTPAFTTLDLPSGALVALPVSEAFPGPEALESSPAPHLPMVEVTCKTELPAMEEDTPMVTEESFPPPLAPHATNLPEADDAVATESTADVKAEPVDEDPLPEGFFEDLLRNAEEIRLATMSPQNQVPSTEENVEAANAETELQIPSNFFDDLLVDTTSENIKKAIEEEMEIKYAETLRLKALELETLTALEKVAKKKKKKNKRKRRHSDREDSTSSQSEASEAPKEDANPILPLRCGATDAMGGTSVQGESQDQEQLSMLENPNRVDFGLGFKRIKLATPDPAVNFRKPQVPESRLEHGKKRVTTLLLEFRQVQPTRNPKYSNFLYTKTVQRLTSPAANRHALQFHAKRSPLHNVNNVSYAFNSRAPRLNLSDWGLEAMPARVARLGKALGYDLPTLHTKRQTTAIPAKIRKAPIQADVIGEDFAQTESTFFSHVMTQTDEVEAQPPRPATEVSCIGCQTSAHLMQSVRSQNEDLPMMKIMERMDENQLLALNDFAELLLEPASTAMDLYRLRQRMMDIYKSSQAMPAAPLTPTPTLPAEPFFDGRPQPSLVNSYLPPPQLPPPTRPPQQQQRPLFAYHQRTPRPPASEQQYLPRFQGMRGSQRMDAPPMEPGGKFYGRGGKRR